MTDALLGVLLIVATGLIWAVIGAFFSHVAQRGLKVLAFGMVMTLCVSFLAWSLLCHWPAVLHGGLPRARDFVPLMALAGILNWSGMLLIMAAMRRGHQAGSWTVSQSAMVVPFLAGIVFWHDRPTTLNMTGAVLILLAVVVFGLRSARHEPGSQARPWFHIALMAFCIIGVSQTFCTIPSHWAGWSDAGGLRVPVFTSAALAFLATACAIRREWPGRREVVAGSLCSLAGLAGNYTFFAGMDLMATRHLVALVYPTAIGVCMTAFVLYTRFWGKERLGWGGLAALGLGVAGVALLAV